MVTLINSKNDTWQFMYLGKTTLAHPGGKPGMVHLGAHEDHGVVGRPQPKLQIKNEVYEKIKHQIGDMAAGLLPRIRVIL